MKRLVRLYNKERKELGKRWASIASHYAESNPMPQGLPTPSLSGSKVVNKRKPVFDLAKRTPVRTVVAPVKHGEPKVKFPTTSSDEWVVATPPHPEAPASSHSAGGRVELTPNQWKQINQSNTVPDKLPLNPTYVQYSSWMTQFRGWVKFSGAAIETLGPNSLRQVVRMGTSKELFA